MRTRAATKSFYLSSAGIPSTTLRAGFAGCRGGVSPAHPASKYTPAGRQRYLAPSKCASISSSVLPLVSGKNQVAVTK